MCDELAQVFKQTNRANRNHVALFGVNSAENSPEGSLYISHGVYVHLRPFRTMYEALNPMYLPCAKQYATHPNPFRTSSSRIQAIRNQPVITEMIYDLVSTISHKFRTKMWRKARRVFLP
jgi:hypothetical protein